MYPKGKRYAFFNHLHPLTPKLNLDTTTSPRFTLCRSQMGVTAGFYA